MRGRRGWPSNARTIRTVFRGPDPLTTDVIDSIDQAWGRGMRGGTGTVRIGMPSGTFGRFNGDGGMRQTFLGGGTGLGTARPTPGFNRALPGTSGPQAGTSNDMADLLGAAGL